MTYHTITLLGNQFVCLVLGCRCWLYSISNRILSSIYQAHCNGICIIADPSVYHSRLKTAVCTRCRAVMSQALEHDRHFFFKVWMTLLLQTAIISLLKKKKNLNRNLYNCHVFAVLYLHLNYLVKLRYEVPPLPRSSRSSTQLSQTNISNL
jgi:hypothetical protein